MSVTEAEVPVPSLQDLCARRLDRKQAEELARATLLEVERSNNARRTFIRLATDPSPAEPLRSESLLGCLFSVKDNIDVAGLPTTCGSRLFAASDPAAADAWIVRALRQAGAQCLGKNNMDELALAGTGINPLYGAVRNPWDAARGVGGSSGGSAAAVALRQVHVSVGTDSGGSVRMPAAMCGIVGFKPTPGILSLDGVQGAAWSIDNLGLMTGNMGDMAKVWSAIAHAAPAVEPAAPRIAYLEDDSMGRADPTVWAGYLAAVERLRRAGVDLAGVSMAGLRSSPHICVSIVYAEAASTHYRLMRERGELYDPAILALFYLGEIWSGRHYIDAQRLRAVLAARFAYFIDPYDAVLLPTLAVRPPRLGEPAAVEGDPLGSELYTLMRFIVPFNVIGYPAISIPIGFDAGGLPIGVQLVGRPHADAVLLAIASRAEAIFGVMPTPRL